MKARIVKGPVGYYSVEIKSGFFSFWRPLYNSTTKFPWRGSREQANKIVKKINNGR